jgi:hypothetical protein
MSLDRPREIGQKYERAFQDGDQIDGAFGVVGIDLLPLLLDALLDLFG